MGGDEAVRAENVRKVKVKYFHSNQVSIICFTLFRRLISLCSWALVAVTCVQNNSCPFCSKTRSLGAVKYSDSTYSNALFLTPSFLLSSIFHSAFTGSTTKDLKLLSALSNISDLVFQLW